MELYGAGADVVEDIRLEEKHAKLSQGDYREGGLVGTLGYRAERAVLAWLIEKYPSHTIKLDNRGFFDFSFELLPGFLRSGVAVKLMPRFSAATVQALKNVERSAEIEHCDGYVLDLRLYR
jgi:hypothetical protein